MVAAIVAGPASRCGRPYCFVGRPFPESFHRSYSVAAIASALVDACTMHEQGSETAAYLHAVSACMALATCLGRDHIPSSNMVISDCVGDDDVSRGLYRDHS